MCQDSQGKVGVLGVSSYPRQISPCSCWSSDPSCQGEDVPAQGGSIFQTILLSPPQPALKSAAGPGLHFEKYRANEALFPVSYINEAASFWCEWSSLVLVIADALQGGNNLDFLCQIASESQMWKSIFLSLPCRGGQTVQLRGSLTSPLGELLADDKMAKDPGTVILHYCSGFMRNLSAHLGLFLNLWIALSTYSWKRHWRSLMSLCDTGVFSGQFQAGQIPSEGGIT